MNWLAIIAATLAYYFIGAIWYSKILFGKTWMELANVQMTEETKKKMPMIMAGTFVISFVFATAIGLLSLAVTPLETGMTAKRCIELAVIVSGGIACMTVMLNGMYEGKPMKLLLINCGYNLVGSIAISLIVGMWRHNAG